MPFHDLIAQAEQVSPIADEVRIGQTMKLIERTFGMGVDALGTVEMRDGQPCLLFEHQGASHTMTWQRETMGDIVWTLDGKRKLKFSGDTIRDMKQLRDALEG